MSRILSIEDDPDMQHLVSLALQGQGYDVHYAFTGKEGYEKVLSINPDLILLDMMLPLLNGAEVIKLVRRHKQAKDIPIIVLTCYSDDARFVESAVKSLGVVEYIRKPADMKELLGLIRRVLSGRAERTAPNLNLRRGGMRLDPKFRTLWINDRLAATLTPKRFDLLFALMQSRGEVPSDALVRDLWGSNGTKNDLEKAIQRLRDDLEDQSYRIKTTANGYQLADLELG